MLVPGHQKGGWVQPVAGGGGVQGTLTCIRKMIATVALIILRHTCWG